ncbi:hypothetical protein BKA93DRAFT_828929 [Sparassis latifolia]
MIPRPSVVELFPTELFLMVKEYIPHSDVRTHACFYSTHPRIAAIYDANAEDQDLFWRHALWLSGIGLLDGEDPEKVQWKKLALGIVDRDGFCTNPRCGGALLEQNAEDMRKCMEHAERPFAPFAAYPADAPVALPLLTNAFLAIDAEFVGTKPSELVRIPTGQSTSAGKPIYTPLRAHPIASRSFATFPPIQQMWFNPYVGQKLGPASRRYGVTVRDVLETINEGLDEPLQVPAVAFCIGDVMRSLADWDPETPVPRWNIFEAMARLATLRKVLRYFSRFDRIELLSRADHDPVFVVVLRKRDFSWMKAGELTDLSNAWWAEWIPSVEI